MTDIVTQRDLSNVISVLTKRIQRLTDKLEMLSTNITDNDPLEVKLLSPDARMPVRATAHAAGFDVYTSREGYIEPGKYNIIHTDISMRAPKGCYIRVATRSGLNTNLTIETGAGVVDRDFVDEVSIILTCRTVVGPWGGVEVVDGKYKIPKGTRIAQVIIEKVSMCKAVECDRLSRDPDQETHEGFGSTGVTF